MVCFPFLSPNSLKVASDILTKWVVRPDRGSCFHQYYFWGVFLSFHQKLLNVFVQISKEWVVRRLKENHAFTIITFGNFLSEITKTYLSKLQKEWVVGRLIDIYYHPNLFKHIQAELNISPILGNNIFLPAFLSKIAKYPNH